MRVLPNILLLLFVLALLYGGVLVVERMTTQELTRISEVQTQETICLIWHPRLLRGDGVCSLDLLNAEGRLVATAPLGSIDTSFNALQHFGQLSFQGANITVTDLRTGELVRRFTLRDGRLIPAE